LREVATASVSFIRLPHLVAIGVPVGNVEYIQGQTIMVLLSDTWV
jgi:hypothetical protein